MTLPQLQPKSPSIEGKLIPLFLDGEGLEKLKKQITQQFKISELLIETNDLEYLDNLGLCICMRAGSRAQNIMRNLTFLLLFSWK